MTGMAVSAVQCESRVYPLSDLVWQEGTDHGKDWTEEHWLIDQMNSSNLQWKRVLRAHAEKNVKKM